MAHAIRIHSHGGPDVLSYENIENPKAGPCEVLIRQSYVGLNFIDVYFRTGLYPIPSPFIPGMEAAGVIEEIGAGVSEFKPGQRVAYATAPIGAYTDLRAMPADRVIALPDTLSEEIAAASMVQGMTAEYLLLRTFRVQKGQTILLHAAAGGVGLIATQWAKSVGATVIGTVGSTEKASLAKAHGCDHTILYNTEDIAARVMEITDGKGVPVVYDSVGQATFEASLNALKPRGTLVSFGNASGPVPDFAPSLLAAKGSLYLTRPSFNHYMHDNDEYRISAEKLFEVIGNGSVKININQRYALQDAAQAHQDLEDRKTTGSTVFEVR